MNKTAEMDSRIAAGNAETARRAAEKFILGIHLNELAAGYGMPKEKLALLIKARLIGMDSDDRQRIRDGQRYYAPCPL